MSDKFQPAFPSPMFASQAAHGMTLRDYFAAQVITSWLHVSASDQKDMAKKAARLAYEVADAMLAEREKGTK